MAIINEAFAKANSGNLNPLCRHLTLWRGDNDDILKHNDPLAPTLAVTTLLFAALASGYVPARKTSRIDPTAALRHE